MQHRSSLKVTLALGALLTGVGIAHAQSLSYQTLDNPSAANQGTVYSLRIDGNNIVEDYAQSSGAQSYLYNGSSWSSYSAPSAVPGTTLVTGISGSETVGNYVNYSGQQANFVNNGSSYSSLNVPNSTANSTVVSGISGNNVAGYFTQAGRASSFLYNPSTGYTILTEPNATGTTAAYHYNSGGTYAYGISGNSVVGAYNQGGYFQGFLYNGGQWTSLSAPSAQQTYAIGMSGNYIVGYDVIGGVNQGFLYNTTTGAWTAVLDPLGSLGTTVTGISGNTLVGTYVNATGSHGFVASLAVAPGAPAPPMTACLAFAGVLVLQALRRRRIA